jgi:hypothetical protein
MAYAHTKEQAHELIDRMAPCQVSAVVGLLETMLDPVSRAIANAPIDDERESEEERRAVAESKAWLAAHPGQTISHAQMMAEFGLSGNDINDRAKTLEADRLTPAAHQKWVPHMSRS